MEWRRGSSNVLEKATSEQWEQWLRVPLEHALAEGEKDLALTLLRAGADGGAGWEGCDDRTMLQAAAEGGDEEVVSTLLGAGGLEELDVASGEDEMTALHRALARGHSGVARVLMLAGADGSLVDAHDRSALHYAVKKGLLQVAGDVLIAGANPEAEDINGNTPLHLAAAYNDDKFVSALLRRGVPVNVSNDTGLCPLHVAIRHNRIAVAVALLKAGANPNTDTSQGHHNRFLSRDSPAMTKTLLEYGADVNAASLCNTALHWAADGGEPEIINILVEAGADLEARTRNLGHSYAFSGCKFEGLTPLSVAAFRLKHCSMVALLQNGADVNAESDDGLTPLHMVCKGSGFGSAVEAADLLLRWGADETLTDNDGRTPKRLIKGRSIPTRCLRQVLANAPADRAWRRRSLLVMCRAFPDKMTSRGRKGRGRKVRARAGARRGRGGGSMGRGCGMGNLLARVVELEDDDIFRTIVEFL